MSARDVQVGEGAFLVEAAEIKQQVSDDRDPQQEQQVSEAIKDKQQQTNLSKQASHATYLAILQWILLMFCVASNIYLLSKPVVECECDSSGAQSQVISLIPTLNPTVYPVIIPSSSAPPTTGQTVAPTLHPSSQPNPGPNPTGSPSLYPSSRPTNGPTEAPSSHPSKQPSSNPSDLPSMSPTSSPSTNDPTRHPSESTQPSLSPTAAVSTGTLQLQRVVSHTKVTMTTALSWIEPSADYRVSITPKYLDSHILVTYNFGWNGHGIESNTIVLWSAARSINGSSFSRSQITSSGIVSDARHRISGMASRRNNGQDSNDPNLCHWVTYDYPNTLQTITYTLHAWQEAEGAGSIKIGESFIASSANGFPWSMPVTIIAMEINN